MKKMILLYKHTNEDKIGCILNFNIQSFFILVMFLTYMKAFEDIK